MGGGNLGLMNKAESVLKFHKLLKLRSLLKEIAQFSWTISTIEKRYPVDELSQPQIEDLTLTYERILYDIQNWINDSVVNFEAEEGNNDLT